MDKINVVVVGYGGMGNYHAERIDSFDNFNLAGVYDIKPERCEVARGKGWYAYPSFEAVLEDESVELIVCATYNDCHKDIAIRAMRAGKNVISEKPVTLSSEDLQAMIDASHKYNKILRGMIMNKAEIREKDIMALLRVSGKVSVGEAMALLEDLKALSEENA